MGIETEFGCLVRDGLQRPETAVEFVKDTAFYDLKLGILDVFARDEVFEPAESGGFLMNGGRLYIDAVGSHLEYATPECQTLKELAASDLAGRALIMQAVEASGLGEDVGFYCNSVDHFGGHTFGCHENYSVQMEEDFFARKCPLLWPFLVTRQIYAGTGRVGGHILVGGEGPTYDEMLENPIDYIWVSQVYSAIPDDRVEYQLSQRADHILKTAAGRVRFNRALVNPKWEHYYSHGGSQRLHLLFGEANMNPYAGALKMGTTSLVLQLIEDEILTEVDRLASPLLALRSISRDPEMKWIVMMEDGETCSAIDIQRQFLKLAQTYRGQSDQTDWILSEWELVLDGLEKDPLKMGSRIDWVAKRKILEMFMEEDSLDWTAESLHSLDMEYHSIDPKRSLYEAWRAMNGVEEFVDDLAVIDATTDPPLTTRAKTRGDLIKAYLDRGDVRPATIDWSLFAVETGSVVDLTDPYEAFEI